ncbi:hypothetical protein L917_14875 [Phytophthora nicotianae]|uniref:Uncharacterized protein n=1 Tax=Phytophthora nicotianae TaxID=4792 RepID=W2KKN6_PHYNI|nr:hypothetical protein L917_14875 [Phytophthora nicotianae]
MSPPNFHWTTAVARPNCWRLPEPAAERECYQCSCEVIRGSPDLPANRNCRHVPMQVIEPVHVGCSGDNICLLSDQRRLRPLQGHSSQFSGADNALTSGLRIRLSHRSLYVSEWERKLTMESVTSRQPECESHCAMHVHDSISIMFSCRASVPCLWVDWMDRRS